jgi:hypothetical protein
MLSIGDRVRYDEEFVGEVVRILADGASALVRPDAYRKSIVVIRLDDLIAVEPDSTA